MGRRPFDPLFRGPGVVHSLACIRPTRDAKDGEIAMQSMTNERKPADGGGGPARYDGFDAMPIAGRWREGRTGKRRADHDPWTGETLVEITLADERDVDEAYRAAARAQPAWQ